MTQVIHLTGNDMNHQLNMYSFKSKHFFPNWRLENNSLYFIYLEFWKAHTHPLSWGRATWHSAFLIMSLTTYYSLWAMKSFSKEFVWSSGLSTFRMLAFHQCEAAEWQKCCRQKFSSALFHTHLFTPVNVDIVSPFSTFWFM